jgi:hypothetical protein
MDSEEAAARLDLMELLAGEGAVLSSLQEAKVEQGERARSPSPHVRLRAADLCTSHRREPQVEVDLLSPFASTSSTPRSAFAPGECLWVPCMSVARR